MRMGLDFDEKIPERLKELPDACIIMKHGDRDVVLVGMEFEKFTSVSMAYLDVYEDIKEACKYITDGIDDIKSEYDGEVFVRFQTRGDFAVECMALHLLESHSIFDLDDLMLNNAAQNVLHLAEITLHRPTDLMVWNRQDSETLEAVMHLNHILEAEAEQNTEELDFKAMK